tara:strand:- start:12372 stop:14234 length:1863 start_codon:yes stop_codon:yes gene_type:complete
VIEQHSLQIVKSLLGEPNKKLSKPKELRYGSFGSLSIDLSKGTFFDHEIGHGGGLVDLIKREGKDPVTFLNDLGINQITPKIVKEYSYKNEKGEEIYQVVRFEPKTFRPRRKTNNGYVFNLAGITPLPYNLPQIVNNADKPIFICEGEKDCDALTQLGLIATCNSGGAGNWNKELNKYFIDRNVILIPDNDKAGEKHVEIVATHLSKIVKAIKILHLPVNEKEDISDWLANGGNKVKLNELIYKTEIYSPTQLFKSWKVKSAINIAPRDFIYGNHYIRKYVSLTASQGGLGKSTVILTECIAMATGRNLLGIQPQKKYKTIFYNAEDPLDEIERRVIAICEYFNIKQEELINQLFVASGREQNLMLAAGLEGLIQEDAFLKIEDFCIENCIDVLVFDPLANMTSSLETNEIFKEVAKRLSHLAEKAKMSIEIVHHTRKLNGNMADVDSVRGGSALIAAVRSARLLNLMSRDEADKAGLETNLHHFKMEDAKNNLSASLLQANWYERVSVALDNTDEVGVVKCWKFPDAFSDVTLQQARKLQFKIDDCKPRLHHSADNWVGKIIAEELELNVEDKFDKAKIITIIKGWIKTKVLEVQEENNSRSGRSTKIVIRGSNIINLQ